MLPSLLRLLLDKISLEDKIKESGGETNNDLDLIWQQKDLAVKEKIDAYGHLFTELDAEEAKLKALKDRIAASQKRIDALRVKLKSRLYSFSNGEPLRGTIFSFLPYESTHKMITNPELLSSSERYLTIEITEEHWDKLIKGFENYQESIGKEYSIEAVNGVAVESPVELNTLESYATWKIISTKGKVSELSDDHPAIVVIKEPSVRIS